MLTERTPPESGIDLAHENMRLNKFERVSISALLAYAAFNRHMSEESIREAVTDRFGVAAIEKLPRCAYDAVVQFLVEMQDKPTLN